MSVAIQEGRASVEATCRVCREYPPRPDCYLSVEGAEESVCRFCWEQAVLDPRRIARRLRGESSSARFRTI